MWRTLLVAGVLLILAGCRPATHDYNGTYVDPPAEPKPFQLESAAGPVTLDDLKGDWAVLFFGYTHCPDICPATMSVMRHAMNRLDEDQQDRVRVMMVSVDPERDTPDRLASYTSAFNPDFMGVTGSLEQIAEITSDYGIYYKRLEDVADGSYDVDHTAALLLLDPDGRMRLVWSFGTSSEEIADDLRHILQ